MQPTHLTLLASLACVTAGAVPLTPPPSTGTRLAPPSSTHCPPAAPRTPAPHAATLQLPRNPDERLNPGLPMRPAPPPQDLPLTGVRRRHAPSCTRRDRL